MIIGIVAARGGNTRLPDKNVLPIHGKPLIAWTLEAAKAAKTLDQVVVSTDDDAIAAVAQRWDVPVVWRPAELAGPGAAIDDAYRHVVDHFEGRGEPPDIVLAMQGNTPLRPAGEIDVIVRKLLSAPEATAVATAKRITERPEWMKRTIDATGRIAPFMDAGTRYRTQDFEELYYLDGATMAIRSEVLKARAGDRRVHAYLGDHVLIHVHEFRFAHEVDEREDVPLAELLLASESDPSPPGPASSDPAPPDAP